MLVIGSYFGVVSEVLKNFKDVPTVLVHSETDEVSSQRYFL